MVKRNLAINGGLPQQGDGALDSMTRLAIGYAPSASREALATLFTLDRQLERIALSSGEAALIAIRLQYWIDAISEQRPQGIPLLIAVEQHWFGGVLAPLAAAWGDYLEQAGAPEQQLAISCARGRLLFGMAVERMGAAADAPIKEAGAGWALARIDPAVAHAAAMLRRGLEHRWPRPCLPLRLISRLALDRLEHPGRNPTSRRQIARLLWWATINR